MPTKPAPIRLPPRVSSLAQSAGTSTRGIVRTLQAGGTRLRPAAQRVTGVVTPLGWSVLGLAGVSWWLARHFGWVEFAYLATAALILTALCALLTIGRTTLRVAIELHPLRLVVGDTSIGRIEVTNLARTRLLPIAVELPIGRSAARFNLPSVAAGGIHEELFQVPTARRGIIPVGPATTVRGDPLGLLRRTRRWTDVTEVFIHPTTIAIDTLSSGLLRDLEGQSTNDLSMSDLAFHTLREYVSGDDRRYIHWRSSAKLTSVGGTDQFLVRQFLDTRRSHLAIVVDSAVEAYRDPEDFELAISAAASITIRAFQDEIPVSLAIADQRAQERPAAATLDSYSRAELNGSGLTALCADAARMAADASVAVVITGAHSSVAEVRRAAGFFPAQVKTVALVVDPSRRPTMTSVPGLIQLTIGELAELPALLYGAGLQ